MNAWTLLAVAGTVAVWLAGPHINFDLDHTLVRAGSAVTVSAPFMLVAAAAFLGARKSGTMRGT